MDGGRQEEHSWRLDEVWSSGSDIFSLSATWHLLDWIRSTTQARDYRNSFLPCYLMQYEYYKQFANLCYLFFATSNCMVWKPFLPQSKNNTNMCQIYTCVCIYTYSIHKHATVYLEMEIELKSTFRKSFKILFLAVYSFKSWQLFN